MERRKEEEEEEKRNEEEEKEKEKEQEKRKEEEEEGTETLLTHQKPEIRQQAGCRRQADIDDQSNEAVCSNEAVGRSVGPMHTAAALGSRTSRTQSLLTNANFCCPKCRPPKVLRGNVDKGRLHFHRRRTGSAVLQGVCVCNCAVFRLILCWLQLLKCDAVRSGGCLPT
jgi:hypothetical protein